MSVLQTNDTRELSCTRLIHPAPSAAQWSCEAGTRSAPWLQAVHQHEHDVVFQRAVRDVRHLRSHCAEDLAQRGELGRGARCGVDDVAAVAFVGLGVGGVLLRCGRGGDGCSKEVGGGSGDGLERLTQLWVEEPAAAAGLSCGVRSSMFLLLLTTAPGMASV
jgi:hypothetical protein